ncbi:MAG: trehalose-phosphatase [Acidimicrobiales bacterium]
MALASDDAVAAALHALRQDPARSAILVDFDGTLAPIVEDPEAAVPLPGIVDALDALRSRFGVVAVVSGRPVSYLQRHLSGDLVLVGLYGLERVRDRRLELHPEVAGWRSVVAEVVEAARRELPDGVGVEDKGLSLTLHVRPRPDLAEIAQQWATAAAVRSGLHVRRARMSAELHPPVAADKGTVTAELIAGLAAACFVGDDVGDLPAFAALDAFAAEGRVAVRVVVTSNEATPELLASADALLDGPPAVLEFLTALQS